MKSLLTWQEALALLKQTDEKGRPIPVSVVFVTADQEQQTGGEIIEFKRAVLCRRGDDQRHATSQAPARSAPAGSLKPKKPSWMYRLRNLASDQIRWVDLHLILYVNDHPVR